MAQTIPIPYLYLLIALVSVLELVSAQVGNRISLQTQDGSVFVGLRDQADRSRREFYSFTGIAYAAARERFQEAELLEVERGTHYATAYGSECPQYDHVSKTVKGNENCLYLNVYTPHVPSGVSPLGTAARGPVQSSRPLLPVLFFIHGGSFQQGSGDQYGAKRLMRDGGVVLVTLNYRLGVLGFLSTGDEAIPGNLGSLDQIVALKWVEKYIREFGGNPHRVTIVGSSAGAALAHALMLSPRAMGLFHAAIIQSGSAFCDWAVNENPQNYAEKIGEAVGCSLGDSFDYLACLQEKPMEELVEAQASLHKLYMFPVKASLVVDTWRGEEAFLPASPRDLMEAGAFAQVPVIAGVTHDEGIGFYANLHLEIGADKFKDPDYFENEFLPELISNIMDKSEPLSVTVDAVKAQYFEELDVVNETKRVITELTDMLGDSLFYSCHWDMLEKFAAGSRSPVYSYVFSHKTPSSPSIASKEIRRIRQMGIHHPLFNYGISHGDELFYLFEPVLGSLERMGAEDERVSDMVTRAWVSFATTGSPASGLQLTPNAVPWRPIKPGNINYYNLTSMPSPMGEDFRKGEALFWLRTLPYIQELGTTISELEDYPTYFWIALGIAIFLLLVTLILACILCRSRSY